MHALRLSTRDVYDVLPLKMYYLSLKVMALHHHCKCIRSLYTIAHRIRFLQAALLSKLKSELKNICNIFYLRTIRATLCDLQTVCRSVNGKL